LYDNAPIMLEREDLIHYLNTYLPKNNTHEDGAFIPMLCKTLEDNKPFEKGRYLGQWKINGERCIITAREEGDLFKTIKLHYRSREGVDWTNKLSYLDDYIIPCLSKEIITMMMEEGVGLDGELYLPGYGINEINSFIKNTELPQHYQLQYWLYDLCIENMSAIERQKTLGKNFCEYHPGTILRKEDHFNIKQRLVLLDNTVIDNFNQAIGFRDIAINLGFEGLVIRKEDAEYQFGGKRNNSMLKFKKKYDGWFEIVDVVPEGRKRSHLGKFVLRNDINGETFECTYNAPQSVQEEILNNKSNYVGKLAFVEYRERSGVNQLPFHAKATKIK
ncbi:MAG: hypothetical protein K2M17_05280, partial [Bacilli bacterium]|nr:hypothetical protein [Bacilli bacterium]